MDNTDYLLGRMEDRNMRKDMMIRKVLLKLGISSNLQGYKYILESIKILKNQQIHTNITTIYEMIAKKDSKKAWNRIERSIRHAIDHSYKESEILKNIYNKKPDNSVFLYDITFNFDIFLEQCN